MIKLYIDCTGIYRHNLNAGIQRVVRNITAQLLEMAPARGIDCVPVACTNGIFHPCQLDDQGNLLRPAHLKLASAARKTLQRVQRTLCWLLPFRPVYAFCYAGEQEFGLPFMVHKVANAGRKTLRFVRGGFARSQNIQPGVLLCADAGFTYLDDLKKSLPALRAGGTKIITMIYDLIPITSPEYCNPGFSAAFDVWLRFVVAQSHGLICISDAVRQEVASFLQQIPPPKPAASKLDYFHLGYEINDGAVQPVNVELRERVFGDERPVLLMVGTMEPRKNHEFVLRAFERLWREGREYKLCFMGRYGSNTGELVARWNTHRERGNRFFILTDVADADLTYAYNKAFGLICASLKEGFGLPMVEALARGLPVLASDIPVFREIAGAVPVYFDPADVNSLCAAIVEYCEGARTAAARRTANFSPLSWKQSADMLLTRVLRLADVDNKSRALGEAPSLDSRNSSAYRRQTL